MMHPYYNRQGEPITDKEWLEMMKRPFEESRRVAKDEQNGIEVSTVFLAINHQWSDGLPILFETMIFGGEHNEEQWRYSTEAQALVGHETAVTLAFGTQVTTE